MTRPHGLVFVHCDDCRQVLASEVVAATEHGERDFAGRCLAFEPTRLDAEDRGRFIERVDGGGHAAPPSMP
jgi:hypothetical protein